MNQKQKTVILVAAAILLVMGLYPPWLYTTYNYSAGTNSEWYLTETVYAFLFQPPTQLLRRQERNAPPINCEPDWARLTLQMALVVIVAGATVVWLARPDKP